MTPLIDADCLRYEIGAVGQIKNEDGTTSYRDFEWVASTLDQRIEDICRAVDATGPPIVFLTGDRTNVRGEFKPNFRIDRAVSKPYKGTRLADRPFHYPNLSAYIQYKYDTRLANGCEADDCISIEQSSRLDAKDTIICTRDKDLRQCPGWHYGWECGKQPEFGPVEYDEFGTISLERGKIRGGGLKFFFSQLLTGDTVDNIGGLRGYGPAKSFQLLNGATSEAACKSIITTEYQKVCGGDWLEYLKEQSDLLWIVKELNEDGSFKHYSWD